MHRYAIALAGGLLATALGVVPASSDETAVEDPVGDGHGSVDLVSGTHGHGVARSTPLAGFAGSVLTHEIETTDEWSFEGEAVELRMTSPRWERPRRLFVQANPDGSLVGVVFTDDEFRGYANVYEKDASTLRIELPESVLGADVPSYRWRVFATGSGDNVPDPPDRLPDAGSVRHGGLWRYRP